MVAPGCSAEKFAELAGLEEGRTVQGTRVGEIAQCLRDRTAPAGHIDFRTLRDVSGVFLVYGGGEIRIASTTRSVASPWSVVCPGARDADVGAGGAGRPATPRRPLLDFRRPAPALPR